MHLEREDYQQLKLLIREQAIWLSMQPEPLQAEFLKILVSSLPDDQKVRLFDKFVNMVYPEWRWKKAERWMEKRFMNDMNRTPRQVASMYLMYCKINTKMAPKIIVLAQKVKDRLRKRIELGIRNHSHSRKS